MNENNDGGSVVYIDTENTFSAKRLLEIFHGNLECHRVVHSKDNNIKVRDVLSHIFVYLVSTFDLLNDCLENLEELIIRHKVKLIVLDSIASLIRNEFGHHALLNERIELMVKQSSLLKKHSISLFSSPTRIRLLTIPQAWRRLVSVKWIRLLMCGRK